MSRLRCSLLVGVAVAIGCGGASSRRDRVDDEPAGAGGTAGASGTGGTGTGSGGSGSAGGATPSVPGQSERENEILSPLFTDDETIAAASGEELVELAMAIGLARGYAMCRCFFSPSGPPESFEDMLLCARDESAFAQVSTETAARCVTERIHEVEGIEEVLRCQARRARPLGLVEFSVCSTGMRPEAPPMIETCDVSPEIDTLFQECRFSFYCDDESRVLGARCNTIAECPDLSDERRCLDVDGRDFLTCDDEIWHPVTFCRYSMCGVTSDPPLCDPTRPERFLCEDGSDVDANVVCDRVTDCPDGQDEVHCLR